MAKFTTTPMADYSRRQAKKRKKSSVFPKLSKRRRKGSGCILVVLPVLIAVVSGIILIF